MFCDKRMNIYYRKLLFLYNGVKTPKKERESSLKFPGINAGASYRKTIHRFYIILISIEASVTSPGIHACLPNRQAGEL